MNLEVGAPLIKLCLEARRNHTPDPSSEAVLADWAEESGLKGLASGLRDPDSNVGWYVLGCANLLISGEWPTSSLQQVPPLTGAISAPPLPRRNAVPAGYLREALNDPNFTPEELRQRPTTATSIRSWFLSQVERNRQR